MIGLGITVSLPIITCDACKWWAAWDLVEQSFNNAGRVQRSCNYTPSMQVMGKRGALVEQSFNNAGDGQRGALVEQSFITRGACGWWAERGPG